MFAAETINPMGFFTRINHFLRNMDGYLVEQKNDLKQSQSGLDFLNNIGNTSKLFDDKDQEELLLLKNKYDSILTELQNSESQENSKESNYIANIKFIRTSEDSIETLVFDANFGEYAKKAMLTRDENNEYWELCGDKFECLYQAKLRAHHLFNEKYKDVNSTKYDINDIDFKELSNNDGVVFEGEATEELSGSDTFFSDVLEASSANDLLFVDSFQDEKIKKEKPMVKAKKLNAWFS